MEQCEPSRQLALIFRMIANRMATKLVRRLQVQLQLQLRLLLRLPQTHVALIERTLLTH